MEGQLNRLKLVKRRMYGRARFALLRQRALYQATAAERSAAAAGIAGAACLLITKSTEEPTGCATRWSQFLA